MLDLSVIIPTRNKSNNLITLLDTLRNQILPSNVTCEIIIVDNKSDDLTYDILRAYQLIWKQETVLRIVQEETLGVIYARDKGVSISKGNFFLFLDDDVEIEDNFIYEVIKFTKRYSNKKFVVPKIIATTSPNLYADEQYFLENYTDSFDLFNPGDTAKSISLTKEGPPATTALIVRRENYVPGSNLTTINYFSTYLIELKSIIDMVQLSGLWYEPSLVVKHVINRERLTKYYVQKRLFEKGLSKHFKRTSIRGFRYSLLIPVFWINDFRRFLISKDDIDREFWRGSLYSPFYITRKLLVHWCLKWLKK